MLRPASPRWPHWPAVGLALLAGRDRGVGAAPDLPGPVVEP